MTVRTSLPSTKPCRNVWKPPVNGPGQLPPPQANTLPKPSGSALGTPLETAIRSAAEGVESGRAVAPGPSPRRPRDARGAGRFRQPLVHARAAPRGGAGGRGRRARRQGLRRGGPPGHRDPEPGRGLGPGRRRLELCRDAPDPAPPYDGDGRRRQALRDRGLAQLLRHADRPRLRLRPGRELVDGEGVDADRARLAGGRRRGREDLRRGRRPRRDRLRRLRSGAEHLAIASGDADRAPAPRRRGNRRALLRDRRAHEPRRRPGQRRRLRGLRPGHGPVERPSPDPDGAERPRGRRRARPLRRGLRRRGQRREPVRRLRRGRGL